MTIPTTMMMMTVTTTTMMVISAYRWYWRWWIRWHDDDDRDGNDGSDHSWLIYFTNPMIRCDPVLCIFQLPERTGSNITIWIPSNRTRCPQNASQDNWDRRNSLHLQRSSFQVCSYIHTISTLKQSQFKQCSYFNIRLDVGEIVIILSEQSLNIYRL